MNKSFIRNLGVATLASVFAFNIALAKTYSVKSPDGKLEAIVDDAGKQLSFSLVADGKLVMDKAKIAMSTSLGDLGQGNKVKSSKYENMDTSIKNPFGIRSNVRDNFVQMSLSFGDWSLIVRAYNEAVAYRFSANFNAKELIVKDETLELPFASDTKIISHYLRGISTSYEEVFTRDTIAGMKAKHSSMMPFFVKLGESTLVITESDIVSFPAMRMQYKDGKACGVLSKYPKTFRESKFMKHTQTVEDFAAKTIGARDFPWRAFIYARTDAELADNDTVFKLATPSKLADTSWIQAGTCLWDWWNNWNLEGVDFEAGVNEKTFRYMIDFAAEHKIPYVLFDASWLSGVDIGKMKTGIHEALISGKPFIDVETIIEYAHSKNVKVILWNLGRSLELYCDQALDRMASWGVDGIKVDFFNRDDQTAYELYELIASSCAKRKILVDFHGCAKPAGLNRTYPNVVNFEAVRGNEFNKFNVEGTTPSHNIDIVFTRMLQGPMDYTPGATRNIPAKEYKKSMNQPLAMGTRASQAAMYVLYFAPLQMLSDSSTDYAKCIDFLKFIASVPTVWDDTKVIDAKIGERVVMARKKGDCWYIAGLTDWNARDVSIDLAKILDANTNYKAEIIRDGINANRILTDYVCEVKDVKGSDTLKLSMASGGGFALKLSPKKCPFLSLFSD